MTCLGLTDAGPPESLAAIPPGICTFHEHVNKLLHPQHMPCSSMIMNSRQCKVHRKGAMTPDIKFLVGSLTYQTNLVELQNRNHVVNHALFHVGYSSRCRPLYATKFQNFNSARYEDPVTAP